ncbi:MAG: M23 family metallopeptidase [Bacteroidetes bacterium]|nr:M23 family metallopeptidase [Bacteroidota bacterium]
MAKTKYIFNSKSLAYEEVRKSSGQKIANTFLFLITALAFSVGLTILAYTFTQTPRERMQKAELEQVKLQYSIMNDRLDKLQVLMKEMSDRDDNIYRVIFEAEPIPKTIRQAGYGGVDRYDQLDGYSNSELLIRTAKKLDVLASQMYVQSKSFDEVFEMARNKEIMLASIPAIQPVSNTNLKRLSSFYGYRIDPIYKINKFHAGVDFSAPRGTPIYSSGSGKVIRTSKASRGYGNTITIDHGFGYQTFYAHIQDIKVKIGEEVKRGQLIGTVGNTGKSTAPHLHYEVKKNGHTVNPIYYFFNDLSPDEFGLVLEQSNYSNQTLD